MIEDENLIADICTLRLQIRELYQRSALQHIQQAIDTSITPEEARQRLINLIEEMREDLNIDQSQEYGLQHPDEWGHLPEPPGHSKI